MKVKDPYDLSADKTTYKIVSLPKWQREWLRNHKSVNFSGLAQEVFILLIKSRDPEYYQKYKNLAENEIRRKETTFDKSDLIEWAKIIKQRDVYCQICGVTEELEAHHIFHKSKEPTLAFNGNNSIVLCKKCHYETHGKTLN